MFKKYMRTEDGRIYKTSDFINMPFIVKIVDDGDTVRELCDMFFNRGKQIDPDAMDDDLDRGDTIYGVNVIYKNGIPVFLTVAKFYDYEEELVRV